MRARRASELVNAAFFLIISALMFFAVSALMFFAPPPSLSEDPETPGVRKLQEEIARLKADNEANRRKMEEFEKKLEQLASTSEARQKELAAEVAKRLSPSVVCE